MGFTLNGARVFVALIALTACEDDAPPSASACELLAQERAACDASVSACEGELDECNAGCVVGLGCADLLDPSFEPGALACRAHCAPKYTCRDGVEIADEWKCDGTADCADGDDEERCQ